MECCPCCKKPVNNDDYGVQCEIFCKDWFHCACVSISDAEYEYMQALAEKSKWACQACDSRLSNVSNQLIDIDSFLTLNRTVEKLVAIVKGVVDDNIILNNKIDKLFDTNLQADSAILEPDVYNSIDIQPELELNKGSGGGVESSVFFTGSKTAKPDVNVDVSADLGLKTVDSYSSILNKSFRSNSNRKPNGKVNTSAEVGEVTKVNEVIVDLEPGQSSLTDWKTVSHRRKGRGLTSNKTIAVKNGSINSPIIGSKKCEVGKLRAVEKREWIFVSRLAPDVIKQDLVSYLTDSHVTAECVELTPKHNSYKSFKVGVTPDLTSKILDASFWPSGTLVRNFVPKKKDEIVSRTFLGKK